MIINLSLNYFNFLLQNTRIYDIIYNDLLWEDLPDSYDYVSVENYRQQILNYIYQTYSAA